MKNKKYTATDFENYHAGNMPSNEMYLLEKAALHDLFLADALDGYKNTKNTNASLKDLQQKLTEKIKTEKAPVKLATKHWWAAAAAVVGIVGIAFLFNKFNKTDSNNIAALEKTQIIDSNKKAMIQKVDSITVANETIVNNGLQQNTLKQTDITIPPATYKTVTGNTWAKEEKIGSVSFSPTISSKIDSSKDGEDFLKANAKPNEGTFDNIVVDDVQGKQKEANKSLSDSIVFNKREVAPIAAVVSKKMDNVAYSEKEDVVVATGISRKSRKTFKDKISNADAKDMLQLDNSIAAFKAFAKKNMDKTLADQFGNVTLQFDLDSQGNATNIKVTKKLNDVCNAEAIRILKSYSAWGQTNIKNVSVSVSFGK